MHKIGRKNTKYLSYESILKINHLAKAIVHAKAKWLKKKCQKRAKNHSLRTLQLFCTKNRSKQHQIFEKRDGFENRPSYKGHSPCKGRSLCKMLSLTEKLKMQKKHKEPFWNNISFVLWKKPLKKHQMFEKWDDFGNRPSCKGYSPCKG